MPSVKNEPLNGSSGPWPISLLRDLLLSPRYFWLTATLLFFGELALGLLIIWKIPYTKIDWPAYMQQVDMFLAGERDYSKIEGETGPLVYPALHLYIYSAFHELLPTFDRIRPAQYIFLGIYLSTFLLVSYIYRRSGAPQILLIPLTPSKRAHSIYLLRLFNDPLAMLFLYAAVAYFERGSKNGWRMGCGLFSLALGIKMNVLLFVPGLLVLLFQYRGLVGTVESIFIIALIQLLLPAPFFTSDFRAYFTSAFDFSRQFLYEWTVNWRFVPESTFLSPEWANGLLLGHLSVLIAFAWFCWSPVKEGTWRILSQGLSDPWRPPRGTTNLPASHIPAVLFTSNLIGMTFARSLHYQFHSWYFHQVPLLLWLGGAWGSPALGTALWVMSEWAWAKAPATPFSSAILLGTHAVMIGGLRYHSLNPRHRDKAS